MSQLTDEQVNEIGKAMEENLSPDLVALREIQKGNIPKELLEEEPEQEMYAKVDPTTGNITGYSVPDMDSDIVNDVDLKEVEDAIDDPKNIENALKKSYDVESIDNESIVKIKDLMIKRRSGERIKYADMPEDFKKRIMETICGQGNTPYVGNKEVRNQMAEAIIDNTIMEVMQNEMNKVCVDLGNSVNNYMTKQLGGMINSSRAQQHKIMIEQLPLLASKIEKENPQKADVLIKISDAYKQAYSLEDMFNSFCKGKPKIKRIDIEKIQKLYYEFNSKYDKSKWVIRDVAMLAPILDRNLNRKFNMDDILTFIAVFIKYTTMNNMTPDNIWDHTFMYYVVFNIASLDIYTKTEGLADEDSKFYEGFIANINKFFDVIEERKNK